MQRRNVMVGQINNILCYFGKLDNFLKLRLFNSYCCSLYGSVLWDLSNPCIESVCSSWRCGLRHIFGLPNTTHCSLLAPLSCSLPVEDELFVRSVLFAQRCLFSDSALVSYVASHAVLSNRMISPFGKKPVLACMRYGVMIDDFMKTNRVNIFDLVFSKMDDNLFDIVNMLVELISIRSGSFKFSSDYMTLCDATSMIGWLSTM